MIGAARRRRAFVTGGSRGIGLAVAECLRRQGWSVVTFARSNADITGDVADADALRRAIAIAAGEGGEGLDLLVCAASAAGGGLLRDIPPEELVRMVATDLVGAMLAARLALPHFADRPGVTIALISSMASFHGVPGFAAYSASKAATNRFAEALALEQPNIAVVTLVLGTLADHPGTARPSWTGGETGTLGPSRRFRFFKSASDPLDPAHVAERLCGALGRGGTLYLPPSLRWMDMLSRCAPRLFGWFVSLYQTNRLPEVLGFRSEADRRSDSR